MSSNPSRASSSPSPSPSPLPPLKRPAFSRPRVPFCWVCSRPLSGWIHRVCLAEGRPVVTHVNCARRERLEVLSGPVVPVPLAKLLLRGAPAAEDVIQSAARGDRDAVGAVFAGLGPRLHAEARAVLGAREREADLVLDDLFDSLSEARSSFPPAHGRGVDWLKGIVRAIARARLAKGGAR